MPEVKTLQELFNGIDLGEFGDLKVINARSNKITKQAEVIAELWAPDPSRKSKILYDPSKANNTPSYLFSMEKAKKDFGFVPQYSDFKVMMTDYKEELDKGLYTKLFQS